MIQGRAWDLNHVIVSSISWSLSPFSNVFFPRKHFDDRINSIWFLYQILLYDYLWSYSEEDLLSLKTSFQPGQTKTKSICYYPWATAAASQQTPDWHRQLSMWKTTPCSTGVYGNPDSDFRPESRKYIKVLIRMPCTSSFCKSSITLAPDVLFEGNLNLAQARATNSEAQWWTFGVSAFLKVWTRGLCGAFFCESIAEIGFKIGAIAPELGGP